MVEGNWRQLTVFSNRLSIDYSTPGIERIERYSKQDEHSYHFEVLWFYKEDLYIEEDVYY